MAACATQIPFELEDTEAPINVASFQQAAEEGADIYEIVPAESLVLIHVGRTGSMARLGHDHVVASTDLAGLVALYPNLDTSFSTIAMPLKNLVVDNPQFRQRLELDSEPSESDIAGTYSNMQRVLEADTWPWAVIEVKFANVETSPLLANVSVSLHGVTRNINVPLELEVNAERLTVGGRFTIKQSDFGMTPFSALGGLMRVADELKIHFEVIAVRRNIQ